MDRDRRTVVFQARASDLRLELPMDPMLGTVGVARAAARCGPRWSRTPSAGTWTPPRDARRRQLLDLGVNVPVALFSVGDASYRQGEGESCGTAVEAR